MSTVLRAQVPKRHYSTVVYFIFQQKTFTFLLCAQEKSTKFAILHGCVKNVLTVEKLSNK